MKVKSPKDFWAGLMFCAIGLFFVIVAHHYRMGSAKSMGPGYFPTMLGGLMAVLGAVVFFRSFVVRGERVKAMSFRPLFLIVLSLLVFGCLLKTIGMVLALAFLVIVSELAGHEFRLKEVIILSAGLIVFSVLAFVKGLGLPFPLWPRFPG